MVGLLFNSGSDTPKVVKSLADRNINVLMMPTEWPGFEGLSRLNPCPVLKWDIRRLY